MNKLLGLSISTLAIAGVLAGCDNNNNNNSGTPSSSTTGTPIPAGSLLVSRSTYQGTPSTVSLGQALPGGGTAIADGGFPEVFENETPDASFGVTSPVFIDRIDPSSGNVINTLTINPTQIVSSFSSKSELALNESLDGSVVTFMGYDAPINTLDVSNSNTAEAYDQTNPVPSIYQRAIGQVSLTDSTLTVVPVNAYSGNNGRASVLANGYYYMVGNAGNGSAPTAGLCLLSQNTGVQFIQQGISDGGDTFPVGALVPGAASAGCEAKGYQFGFTVSQASFNGKAQADDKTGKDDNFRGLTVFNNTLYVTKGSGSNGVNTVYQVGAAGAFANGGVVSDAAITILPGFNTLSEKVAEGSNPVVATPHPFGVWFANANTLFVADEGDGSLEASAGKDTTFPGLQQWSFSSANSTWTLVATYQGGLNINAGKSTASITNPSPASGSPASWNVFTDGLRNITGENNTDGSVTIFATTSTTSDDGTHDLGADPNQIVTINIPATQLALTAPATGAPTQSFSVLEQATAGQRLGGVLITH